MSPSPNVLGWPQAPAADPKTPSPGPRGSTRKTLAPQRFLDTMQVPWEPRRSVRRQGRSGTWTAAAGSKTRQRALLALPFRGLSWSPRRAARWLCPQPLPPPPPPRAGSGSRLDAPRPRAPSPAPNARPRPWAQAPPLHAGRQPRGATRAHCGLHTSCDARGACCFSCFCLCCSCGCCC